MTFRNTFAWFLGILGVFIVLVRFWNDHVSWIFTGVGFLFIILAAIIHKDKDDGITKPILGGKNYNRLDRFEDFKGIQSSESQRTDNDMENNEEVIS